MPDIKQYILPIVVLYCCVLKALHGCIQVSKLWYKKLKKVLHTQRYKCSDTNPRHHVANLSADIVDDVLLLADDLKVKQIRDLQQSN